MRLLPDDDTWIRSASGESRLPSRRSVVGWSLLLAAVAGTVVIGMLPAPYVVERPGPVYDTLGDVTVAENDVPLIDIPDEKTYQTSGQLDMLTVYLDGSRQSPLNWIDIATAWFDPSRAVVPIDAVFPQGQTQDEADQESTIDMQNSQKEAVAAALGELDIDYTSVVTVGGVVDGQPADGLLETGDQILTIGDTAVTTPDELRDAIVSGGVGAPLAFGISRDGTDSTVDITPVASSDDPDTAVIGIYPAGDYDFPFEVKIQLENVGGPSAGMMFALGIFDKLTPGELTGGEHIAGTGTIAADGTVGPIGGIRQKMYGAVDDGATWFLAPASNCNEVVGHIPAGLTVFSVATLDDSIAAVTAIATDADTSKLVTCTAD
ncbi:PDZ domain-containing protein [soil metagenome]